MMMRRAFSVNNSNNHHHNDNDNDAFSDTVADDGLSIDSSTNSNNNYNNYTNSNNYEEPLVHLLVAPEFIRIPLPNFTMPSSDEDTAFAAALRRVHELEEKLKEEQTRYGSLVEAFNLTNCRLSEKTKRVSELQTRVSELQTRVSESETKVSELETKVSELDEVNNKMFDKILKAKTTPLLGSFSVLDATCESSSGSNSNNTADGGSDSSSKDEAPCNAVAIVAKEMAIRIKAKIENSPNLDMKHNLESLLNITKTALSEETSEESSDDAEAEILPSSSTMIAQDKITSANKDVFDAFVQILIAVQGGNTPVVPAVIGLGAIVKLDKTVSPKD